jgi:hypothetical protein
LFLLDIFCLGVKSAFFETIQESSLEKWLEGFFPDRENVVEQSGAFGRKLIEGAVKYAAWLGFSPHSRYKQAARVFGGIDAAECTEQFECGREGKPCYMEGPDTPLEISKRIYKHLEAKLGPGGFEFVCYEPEEEEEGNFILLLSGSTEKHEIGKEVEAYLGGFFEEFPEYEELPLIEEFGPDTVAGRFRRFAYDLATADEHGFSVEESVQALLHIALMIWNIAALPEDIRPHVLENSEEKLRNLVVKELSDEKSLLYKVAGSNCELLEWTFASDLGPTQDENGNLEIPPLVVMYKQFGFVEGNLEDPGTD